MPANGQVSVTPLLNFRPGAPDGSITLTVLQNGSAVAQQTYTVTGGVTSGPALLVDVNPSQTLTFAYTTASFQMASFLADKGAVVVDNGVTQTTVGAASFTITMPTSLFALQSPQDAAHYFPLNDPLFGNPYRGWAMAAYNGNGDRATAAISETLFALSSNPDDYKSSTRAERRRHDLRPGAADRAAQHRLGLRADRLAGGLTSYQDLKSRTPGSPAVADGGSSTASGSIKFAYSFQIFFVTISFSVGINAGQTASQPSISYLDLNGDGFVDSVLTADDSSMTVALNPIQRTNLLKTVSRPLGARIDLDYTRVGNTFSMPQSRFVLSRVNVFDGVVGNGPDNQVTTYKYENGFYNRFERDFFGFGRVTEEHRDTAANELLYRSTVREYLNDSYNQFFTQRPGANGTKHVYAGTTRIASKLLRQDTPNSNPNGNTPFEKDIFFYHPDHIGSTNYVTDLNGKLFEHLEYFPFGEAWVEENTNQQRTPYLFSAKELDEETGLYYFGKRYYDPRTSV